MLEKLKARREEGGFTLIELLIVIIILAILAAIVIFAVGTTTKNASVSACNSTVKTVETAIGSYKAQTGTYPANFTVLITTTKGVTGTTVGPWIRTLPYHVTPLGAGHKYAILPGATLTTTGKITVLTSAGKVTGDTGTACKTA